MSDIVVLLSIAVGAELEVVTIGACVKVTYNGRDFADGAVGVMNVVSVLGGHWVEGCEKTFPTNHC